MMNQFEDTQDVTEQEEYYVEEESVVEVDARERKILWQAKDFSIREFQSMR
jgi:hypothetical protein